MDNEFDDIKALYQQKKGGSTYALQDAKWIGNHQLKKLKQYQLKSVLTMALTAGVIIYVDRVSSAKLETSVPGFWILLGCALYYTISKWFLYRKLQSIDPALPVVNMIAQLEIYKKWNIFFQTYAYFVYVLLLSIGVYLYLLPVIEFMSDKVSPRHLKFLKFIWLAWLAWAFINTFFIRKKQLATDTKILNGYIKILKSEE